MELKSMKMSAEAKKEMTEPMSPEKNAPKYPYGLELRIENDSMEKLGITKMPAVKSKMSIAAVAEVVSISMSDGAGGTRKCLCLQITDMAVEPVTEKKGSEKVLYGE